MSNSLDKLAEPNFLKDLTAIAILFVGVVGLISVFWHFMFEYQSRQHSHEQNLQTVQINHEVQMVSNQKIDEIGNTKKRIAGKQLSGVVGIANSFLSISLSDRVTRKF